jgi:hypothetical protein
MTLLATLVIAGDIKPDQAQAANFVTVNVPDDAKPEEIRAALLGKLAPLAETTVTQLVKFLPSRVES